MKHSFIQSGFFSSLLNRATQVISGDVTVLLDKICYLSFFNHNLSDLHVCNTKPQRKRWEKVCIFRSFSGRFHRKHTTHRTVVPRFPESHPTTQLEWQWNGSLAWLLAYDINSNVVYFYDCVRIINLCTYMGWSLGWVYTKPTRTPQLCSSVCYININNERRIQLGRSDSSPCVRQAVWLVSWVINIFLPACCATER